MTFEAQAFLNCILCKLGFEYKNYNFRDFLLHLKDDHMIQLHCGLIIILSDQEDETINFLMTSLSNFVGNTGGFREKLTCILCETLIPLTPECGGDFRTDTMENHQEYISETPQ